MYLDAKFLQVFFKVRGFPQSMISEDMTTKEIVRKLDSFVHKFYGPLPKFNKLVEFFNQYLLEISLGRSEQTRETIQYSNELGLKMSALMMQIEAFVEDVIAQILYMPGFLGERINERVAFEVMTTSAKLF